jgi:two-component system sensor histidine kinase CreC
MNGIVVPGTRAPRACHDGDESERFYSLGRPDTGRKSTGLGLNLVREVAASPDGTIRVVNRPEGGALAELTLPRG